MRMTDPNNMLHGNVGTFQFSAIRPQALGATEYTLVTLVLDKTGSVSPFADDLFKIKTTVVDACKKSPRADCLLLRVVEFNTRIDEVHGFLPLSQIDAAQYTTPACEGLTALHDAAYSSIGATIDYAKTLADQEYLVNGLVVWVTDGGNNVRGTSLQDVADVIKRSRQTEALESLRTILVGVNTVDCGQLLDQFRADVGVDQYEAIEHATPERLARLGGFVSRSISAQSQSLGTGGPSQALTF